MEAVFHSPLKEPPKLRPKVGVAMVEVKVEEGARMDVGGVRVVEDRWISRRCQSK